MSLLRPAQKLQHECPRLGGGFWVVGSLLVAEEAVIGVGKLHVDVSFLGGIESASDGPPQLGSDVVVQASPKKEKAKPVPVTPSIWLAVNDISRTYNTAVTKCS
jgi:hypothetical protein